MRSRARWLVLALIALVATAVAWIAMHRSDRSDAVDSRPDAAGADATAPGLLPAPATPTRARANSPSSADKDTDATAPSAAPIPSGRFVRCDLAGLEASSRDEGSSIAFRITARGEALGRVEGVVTTSRPVAATVTIDVTALFGLTNPAGLRVEVDHPAYMPAEGLIAVSDVAERRPDGSIEYPVAVSMRRAAPATGRVLTEDGKPFAGASVSIHRMVSGDPEPEAAESTSTAGDGSFRLRIGASGSALVAAVGLGLRPAARVVAVTVAADSPVGDLVLARGVEISGRVRLAGEPVAAHLSATLAATSNKKIGGFSLEWIDGRAEFARVETEADAEGRYRLTGLREGAYRLSVREVLSSRRVWLLGALTRSLDKTVAAPARDVDFDVRGGSLAFQFRAAGDAKGVAWLRIDGDGSARSISVDMPSDHLALALPATRFEVEVTADGFEKESRQVEAPSIGTVRTETFTLSPSPPRPTRAVLVITLEGRGPAPTRAGVGLFPADSTDSQFPSISRNLESVEGRFRLDDVPAGTFRVVVRAGGTWQGREGNYLHAEATVSVPTAGDAAVTIPVVLGGRLRIAARDEDGKLRRARCQVRDAAGKPVEGLFFVAQAGQASWGPQLSREAPAVLDPPLPVGTYDVEVSLEGFVTQTVSARVEEGRTTDVNVTLTSHER